MNNRLSLQISSLHNRSRKSKVENITYPSPAAERLSLKTPGRFTLGRLSKVEIHEPEKHGFFDIISASATKNGLKLPIDLKAFSDRAVTKAALP